MLPLLAALALTVVSHPAQARVAAAHGDATAARAGQLIGVGDQQSKMFASPLWQQLYTKIVRYIAPYDAAVRRGELAGASAWIRAAEAQHQLILVAFYHSQHTPTKLPGVGQYQRDVRRFIRLFPHVREYQPWDEANRGSVRGRFSSPSPQTAARYYQALRRVCTGCTILGLDLLDQNNPDSTLRYIAQFKREIGHLKTVMPALWGLHNYSDVNRLQGWRTHKISRALRGSIWLTETGGIVQFGHAFRNRRGSGLSRAARVLAFALGLVSRERRIKHAYVYDWSGGSSGARFDAGLTDRRGRPRPAYRVLCRVLLHNSHRCQVATSRR